MNKKRNTYLLLTVVLVIWGLVGYRIFSSLNPTLEATTTAPSIQKFERKPIQEKDTFSILANYRDPFLGKTHTSSKTKSRSVYQVTNDSLGSTQDMTITFSGMMKAKTPGETIFFVAINGSQNLLTINETVQGVRLIKGDDKSITVIYNNARRTIKRD